MRKILAMGCCALYLAFGAVAGLAHVHESADHHEESRGPHLDHDNEREFAAMADEGVDLRHDGHHDCDAADLNATVARSGESIVRTLPAIVPVGDVIDPPSPASNRDDVVKGSPRDPPRETPPRLRAPPA